MVKSIRIACIDGVGYGIFSLFKELFGDEFSFIKDEENPQFVFYSVFGTRHIYYDCVRIFWCGENARADFNFCDYAISFDYLEFEDRHLRFPLYLHDLRKISQNSTMFNKGDFGSEYAEREFCSFVVSNGKADEKRSEVFRALSKYKRVDSAGKFANNVGFYADDKIAFLRKYKFNICFENSYTNGYITEKIIDAKKADTIPVYWGGVTTERIFNKNAFIDFSDFKNINELISFIRHLDSDKNAYLAMLNEPLILDKNIVQKSDEKLATFLRKIFNDENPFRRGFGQWRLNLERRYVKFQKTREAVNKVIDLYRKVIFLGVFKRLVAKKRK